ncbi:hypothetical protein Tco_0711758 [Tanacetum coccineum]
MSNPNTNNNLQTQTSNALHNAIMEAGDKDRPPMLAPGNYNPPYKFKWNERSVPVAKGSSKTTIEGFMESYKAVSDKIRIQLDAKAEAVQIILTWIDNNIYSTIDACPNACEMWKAIERLKQDESINVLQDDEMLKEKEIDKLMALISLSFKKIYKPTNNNLRTSSNTSRANQDNTPRTNRGNGYDNQRAVNVVGARENVGTQDAAYHKEKTLLCKQDEAGFKLSADQANWRDDTNDELEDHELEAHYMYMARIEEVSPNVAENSGPQPESVNDTYMVEHDDSNVIIDSLDMSNNGGEADQDDDDDLAREHLVDKLKSEIEDFKTKNKSLESSNNHFKEANTELAKTNQLMFKDIKKFQDELDRYHDVNYASKVELDCAKAKGELISYKMSSEKSFNEYTRKINDLNQTISDMKQELVAHQEKLSIMSQEKEAQMKFYKTREDKELEKVIALENKVKVLDNIVYKTGQSVKTMSMLNRNCKTSFVKPEFLKKSQTANPRLYDIGSYNDNRALMLAPESDESFCLDQESR